MLGWCPPTVRRLGGYGTHTISTVRFCSTPIRRPHPVSTDDGNARRVPRVGNMLRQADRATRANGTGLVSSAAGVRDQRGPTVENPSLSAISEINTIIPSCSVSLGTRETKPVRDMASTPHTTDSSVFKPGLPHTSTHTFDTISGPSRPAQAPVNPPQHNDPLTILGNFLSAANPSSVNPHKRSTSSLKSFYKSIKAQSQLHRLSSRQLTELLSLFGSLSLPSPRTPCIYINNFVSHMEEPVFKTYWPFVLEIARDKEVLGQKLNGTDRYWIMRAQLSHVHVLDNEKLRSSDRRLHALSEATCQYLRIWRHTADPEVHVPYFEVLLSLQSQAPKYLADVVNRLCKVLDLNVNPHHRLVNMFWKISLECGHDLPAHLKKRMLLTVSTRLSKLNDESSDPPTRAVKLPVATADTSGRKKKLADVHNIARTLTGTVFASHSSLSPSEIKHWAHEYAPTVFASENVPLETRWRNLLLLAVHNMPSAPVKDISSSPQVDLPGVVDWQTIFILSALERTLEGMEATDEPRKIVRPLWRTWKGIGGSDDVAPRPVAISRAIVAAFFRLSAMLGDEPLKDGCFRYCVAQGLFVDQDGNTPMFQAQRNELIVEYVLASISCGESRWAEIFATVARVMPDDLWRAGILEALMWHYMARDIDNVHLLYQFGARYGISTSVDVVHAMSMELAAAQRLDVAASFLHESRFSADQLEGLVAAMIRCLYEQQREYLDSTLAAELGDIMGDLYSSKAPPKHMKYPIRHFLLVMVMTGHTSKAMNVLDLIRRTTPSYFSMQFYIRLMRLLLRHREFKHATALFRAVKTSVTSARSLGIFQRSLFLGLAAGGAHGLARRTYRTTNIRAARRSTAVSLVRSIGFRLKHPSRVPSLNVARNLARDPSDGPSIKYAVTILINARRPLAARKLLEGCYKTLDPAVTTEIGNIILHGPLLRLDQRNGRLVRHILRTKDYLVQKYGFLPDRVTVNILLKAILKWREVIDPPKLKALFDHMVRGGYPAGRRWRGAEGVPFGTPVSWRGQSFELPTLPAPSHISFEKHVRPMYKMFVKAFHLRHDVRAARTVIGILKEEEARETRVREDRNRARVEGRRRKWLRESGNTIIRRATSNSDTQ